jgi:hypothetical protein
MLLRDEWMWDVTHMGHTQKVPLFLDGQTGALTPSMLVECMLTGMRKSRTGCSTGAGRTVSLMIKEST